MNGYFIIITSDTGDTYHFTKETVPTSEDIMQLKRHVAKDYGEGTFDGDEDIDEFFFEEVYDLSVLNKFEDIE